MNTKNTDPRTLLEAVRYFADEDVALRFVAAVRWPDGVTCPACKGKDVTLLSTRRIWKCKAKVCRRQFSVKVGTIMEDSPIPLSKWLPAMWMLANCKNGISSYEVARAIGVTQKTAWYILHRLRLAMQTKTFGKLSGVCELDETFIGGRARNMHKDKRKRVIKGRGSMGKVAVMGLLERHGPKNEHSTIRAAVVPSIRRQTLQWHARENVEPGSMVCTDALASYEGLSDAYTHGVVDHAERYVDGQVHTNGLENFWSLFKRSIKGTYVSIEPFHLFRYLDEQVNRFNNRKMSDAARFMRAAAGIVGRRLTYRDLTGAALVQP